VCKESTHAPQNLSKNKYFYPSPRFDIPIVANFVYKINSVLDDLDVRAIKTGMLYDAETAKTVVDTLKSRFSSSGIPPLVCDPVCVSTSGYTLLCEDALEILISELFPLSTLITPNKSEAELLLSKMGSESLIKSLDDMFTAAEKLASVGCKAVLLKGGHITARMEDVSAIENRSPDIKVIKQNIPGENMEILIAGSPNYDTLDLVVDVLHQRGGQQTMFVRPRIESSSTHGTGCTLSSAIAAQLAKGTPRMLFL
jgi:hydroxymethylpyrimidine/phosphomethylpyrimidine kinase